MSYDRSTNVLPTLYAPPLVTQPEIEYVVELRRRHAFLTERVREAEEAIQLALEKGAGVEAGPYTASLTTSHPRRLLIS